MLLDVQDPVRNLVLNGCFYAIALLALLALVPWKAVGAGQTGHRLRWLAAPTLGLAIIYESAMPSRFDIRVDLFLLLPAYGLILLTSLVRWLAWRRASRPLPKDEGRVL
jgi:hypothetical protein